MGNIITIEDLKKFSRTTEGYSEIQLKAICDLLNSLNGESLNKCDSILNTIQNYKEYLFNKTKLVI